jgi:hypothetical protein
MLPRYTSVGSYPLYYVTPGDYKVLCPACADENDLLSATDGHVSWEGSLTCDACSEEIECAYPERLPAKGGA